MIWATGGGSPGSNRARSATRWVSGGVTRWCIATIWFSWEANAHEYRREERNEYRREERNAARDDARERAQGPRRGEPARPCASRDEERRTGGNGRGDSQGCNSH